MKIISKKHLNETEKMALYTIDALDELDIKEIIEK